MIGSIFGGDGLIVVILAIVVLFGGSQLPKLAKNVGAAGREFRKAQEEAKEEAVLAQALPPVGPAQVVSVPTTSSDDDKLVISRRELREELSALVAPPPATSGH